MMMTNLFSIFDPSSSMFFSLNWLSPLLAYSLFPFQYWIIPSRFIMSWNLMIKFLFNEFKPLIYYSYSNILIFISLLSLIFLSNFLSLFPYIFPATSHLTLSFTLALSLWSGIIFFSIFNYLINFLSHMTPQGTPPVLMPFMVIIESISLIIRPLTLSIRLTANMIAGHLLLTLLAFPINIYNMFLMFIIIITQMLLFLLEITVSFIQAYVFTILITLYSSET